MSEFIEYIYNFIKDILDNVILNNESLFNNFLSKNVFMDTSIIGLNLTWEELILCIGTFTIILIFIILIFKLVGKILYLFKI